MRIPPQLNNILARMETMEMCPRCGRIIYRKEMLDPAPEAPAEPSPEVTVLKEILEELRAGRGQS